MNLLKDNVGKVDGILRILASLQSTTGSGSSGKYLQWLMAMFTGFSLTPVTVPIPNSSKSLKP